MAPTDPRTILIATTNRGKLSEIAAVMADAPITWIGLADVPAMPECVEDGATFEANAEKKAMYYARRSGHWTLADDSGLEVDALGGEPGVHSARYAGEPKSDARNNALLIARLAAVPDGRRTARFRCALALAGDGQILARAAGAVEGVIVDTPRGVNGFGYDPHFLVPSRGQTMAELAADEKNRISHRGQALVALKQALRPLLTALQR